MKFVEQGQTIEELSVTLGVTTQTIRNLLKKHHINVKGIQ
jgi:predicted transcriptional regulator